MADPRKQIDRKKPREVDRQVVLPFGKSVEIAAKSIRARFFRSLVTTISLVLAVAFLAYVAVNTQVANGILAKGDPASRRALNSAGYELSPQDASVGASPTQRWLVALSLLVCVVGITNAQLLSVTERFREIGTMKCLGALDTFILRLFLLEAGMQGLAGALAGAVLGAVTALAGSLFRFGFAAVSCLCWGTFLQAMAQVVAIGCVLTLAGVLYPAWVAARMRPVQAMRSEN